VVCAALLTIAGRAQAEPAAPASSAALPAPHLWVDNPKGPLPDGVTHHTFRSPLMGIEVGYCIYLPPGYSTDLRSRYPVVYFLNGGTQTELSGMKEVAPVFAHAVRSGAVSPMIVVYINGGPAGHYDTKEPKGLGETAFIKELIPYIDETYRTLADRSHRAIEGVSMGGRGTTRDLFKYPELFCSGAALAAGYGNEQKLVDAGQELDNNTFFLAEKYAAHPVPPIRLFVIVGTKDANYPSNLSYMDLLKHLRIPFQSRIVEGAIHSYKAYYGSLQAATLQFHAESFRLAAAASDAK